jgi:hypothetical protein
MIDNHNYIKIIDFGEAKIVDSYEGDSNSYGEFLQRSSSSNILGNISDG